MMQMAVENKKPGKKSSADGDAEKTLEMFLSELAAPSWSVVSFEKCEARNLTYEQAQSKMSELAARKVSGLCIVTDETAARVGG